jgi:hypothetical protein
MAPHSSTGRGFQPGSEVETALLDSRSIMDPETQHVLDVLKKLIRAAGRSHRDVERSLKVGSSYLSRLFSGTMDLRFEHIVAIGRVLGLEPDEVFRFIYPSPEEPPSETLVRLRQILSRLQPLPPAPAYAAASPAALQRDLEQAVASVVGRLAVQPAAPAEPSPETSPSGSESAAPRPQPAKG